MGYVDVLVGLQWGSEGKGKIASYLASGYKAMVRSGGPQAGHTFYNDKTRFVNRQLPCGVFQDCTLYIAPAAIINPTILQEEITRYGLISKRLMIDRNATVLTLAHMQAERQSSLRDRLSSTCEGVGAAQADKIWRTGVLFKEVAKSYGLELYCTDTVAALHAQLAQGDAILIEGTQGFGLCLNHGTYPFVTSRDVTVSALLNDAGFSPKDHRKTIGVMRTYPIRVGGNSGPTGAAELSWECIQTRSGTMQKLCEFTTVTQRLRRVFEQDYAVLERAILVNKPDELALMFIDYIAAEDYGKRTFIELSEKARTYVLEIEARLKVPITLIGTGPGEQHIIDRR